jgi:hypothetical protein
MEVDSLKKLYQAYVASKIPEDRKPCPSARALFKTIRSSASFRKKKRLIDHISRCSYCMEEFCFLLKLHNYEDPMLINIRDTSWELVSFANPIDSIPRPRLWMKYASVLIGFTLIISSLLLIKKNDETLSGLRRSNQIIQLISPTHVHILSNPLIFLWREHPEAQYYVLELFDDTLLPLWTSPKVTRTEIHLPEEIFAKMKINKYYFWMISAFSNAEKVEESDLGSFLIIIK